MVIDHSHCLHEGIANGGANKFETSLAEVIAHPVRLFSFGRDLGKRPEFVPDGRSSNKLPDILVERTKLLLNLQTSLGIHHRSLNFQAIPDDSGIPQQAHNVFFLVLGDLDRVKMIKCLAIILSLLEDRFPTQSGLSPFQKKKLK